MNEINYITLKRHGWTDKLIEKFNLHPTSYNIKSHKRELRSTLKGGGFGVRHLTPYCFIE